MLFSFQTILQKTQETQCSMNELVNSFEETSTIVHNVTNQFLAIQNSQFVENRVYDDETPSEEKKLEIKVCFHKLFFFWYEDLLY